MRISNSVKNKYARNIKQVMLVFVIYIMNIAFFYVCFINLCTEMKYSMKLEHCEISLYQIGYIALVLQNCGLMLKHQEWCPCKQIYTNDLLLKEY